MPVHAYVGPPDSLVITMDSTGRMKYSYSVRVDTTYEGPLMVLAEVDTSAVVQPETLSSLQKTVLMPRVSKSGTLNDHKLQKIEDDHK